MAKINYDNKEKITTSTLPNKNKVSAEDMNEIKTAVNRLTAIKYCTCTTAANVQTKQFVVTDGTQLETGDILCVKHSNTNTFSYNATNLPQASVNGTTYLVKRNEGSPTGTTTDSMGLANNYIYYLFDGEKLAWLGHSSDNNTTYSNASLGQGYGTCSTAESTVAKAVTLSSYSLVNGGIVAVKFTNAVPANATMNVNSKGAKEMWYKGAKITAGVIKAGDLATFIYDGTRYQIISLDSTTGGGSDISEILDKVYPIGSIYMSINNTNPNSLFGGTWVEWGSGKVPVGVNTSETEFNTVEKTGGAKTHTLTAAQSGLPSHSHQQKGYRSAGTSGTTIQCVAWDNSDDAGGPYTRNAGGSNASQAHNNLQPYITCYMWKRTA